MSAWVSLGRAYVLLGARHPLADELDQVRLALRVVLDRLPPAPRPTLWEEG